MQKDSLEKFILDNRAAFDDATPGLKVWADIDRRLAEPQVRKLTWRHRLQMVAAVLLLLFAGGLAGSYLTQQQQNQATAILEQVAPEYFETERFYQQKIDQQLQQLTSYQTDQSVFTDLDQVDQVMEELKAELEKAPKGREQEIIDNLILNYQTKAAILERVLKRMQGVQPAADFIKPTDNAVRI